VLLLFRDRDGMGVKEMAQGGISANQDDLPE